MRLIGENARTRLEMRNAEELEEGEAGPPTGSQLEGDKADLPCSPRSFQVPSFFQSCAAVFEGALDEWEAIHTKANLSRVVRAQIGY